MREFKPFRWVSVHFGGFSKRDLDRLSRVIASPGGGGAHNKEQFFGVFGVSQWTKRHWLVCP